jgi:hypothetical protein
VGGASKNFLQGHNTFPWRLIKVPCLTAAIFWPPNSGMGLNSHEQHVKNGFFDETPRDNFKAEIISVE